MKKKAIIKVNQDLFDGYLSENLFNREILQDTHEVVLDFEGDVYISSDTNKHLFKFLFNQHMASGEYIFKNKFTVLM